MITILKGDKPSDMLHCSRCGQVLKPFESTMTVTPIPGDPFFDETEKVQKTTFTYCGDCTDKEGAPYEQPPYTLADELWDFVYEV